MRKRMKPLGEKMETRRLANRAKKAFESQLKKAGWDKTEQRFAVALAAFNNAIVGLTTEIQILEEEKR